MELLDKAGAFILQLLILWWLFRFIFGILFSRIVARWLANGMLLGAISASVLTVGIMKLGLVNTDSFFKILSFSFLITLNAIVVPVFYWWDKNNSLKDDAERIPEVVLHGVALFGGGIGALFSQKYFNHKTKKESFQRLKWVAIVTSLMLFLYIS